MGILLIPPAVKKLTAAGRRVQRKRTQEAYIKYGIVVNGVRMLPDTPEVQQFLASES
jgi:hypothetical protein